MLAAVSILRRGPKRSPPLRPSTAPIR
jgi:hypothetical protein